MKTIVFLRFFVVQGSPGGPEPLNVILGALWSVAEAISGVFERLGRLRAAFTAPRRPLVSLSQLLGTSRRSIPAFREPNGAPRQRNQAS